MYQLDCLDTFIKILIGEQLLVQQRDVGGLPVITDYNVRRPEKVHKHLQCDFAVEGKPVVIVREGAAVLRFVEQGRQRLKPLTVLHKIDLNSRLRDEGRFCGSDLCFAVDFGSDLSETNHFAECVLPLADKTVLR